MSKRRFQGAEIRKLASRMAKLGYSATITGKNHVKFVKPGRKPLFTSGTPSDHRTARNFASLVKRSEAGN